MNGSSRLDEDEDDDGDEDEDDDGDGVKSAAKDCKKKMTLKRSATRIRWLAISTYFRQI